MRAVLIDGIELTGSGIAGSAQRSTTQLASARTFVRGSTKTRFA
jgi:hypothetical protein